MTVSRATSKEESGTTGQGQIKFFDYQLKKEAEEKSHVPGPGYYEVAADNYRSLVQSRQQERQMKQLMEKRQKMAMTAFAKHRPDRDLIIESADEYNSKATGMFSEEGSALETARGLTSSHTTRINVLGPGTYD